MTNENRMTIILTVVVGLLALAAIIISAVSLAQSSPPAVTVNSGKSEPQNIYVQAQAAPGGAAGGDPKSMGQFGRIYSVAIGHDYGAHEYFDQKGYLAGFGIGFIDLVCGEANIDCRIVWDRYVNCWNSEPGQHAVGGQGLHDRWYDACTGWYTTVERSHVFQFSQAYLKKNLAYFFTLKGASFNTDDKNIMDSKILFLDGWATDEKCLARETSVVKGVNKIKYVNTPDEAINLLKNATAGFSAIFTTEPTLQGKVDDGTLDKGSKSYSCMLDGNAMMSRKDSDFTDQWNKGFNKVKNNGRFKKYCDETNAKHLQRGTVDCIDTY